MEINVSVTAAKTAEPNLPVKCCFKKGYKANTEKRKPKKPLIQSPILNSGAVIPSIMPKSLSALWVQLNSGYEAIAESIQVKATIGEANPDDKPILSSVLRRLLDIVIT